MSPCFDSVIPAPNADLTFLVDIFCLRNKAQFVTSKLALHLQNDRRNRGQESRGHLIQ